MAVGVRSGIVAVGEQYRRHDVWKPRTKSWDPKSTIRIADGRHRCRLAETRMRFFMQPMTSSSFPR